MIAWFASRSWSCSRSVSAPGPRAILGLEGGVEIGPERVNLGFTRRLDKTFTYIELDPWAFVGASLGFGVDSDGEPAQGTSDQRNAYR